MADAMYLTCPHITKNILTYSLERIIDVENSSCTFACMSCDRVFPSLDSVKAHYRENIHQIFVRIGDRPDLYCALCEDFQYCSYFDNIIGKKRKLDYGSNNSTINIPSSASGLTSSAETVEQKLRKTSPGLVNMGSTCFMNSVLQVLAHCREFSNSPFIRSHADSCTHVQRPRSGSITSGGTDSLAPTPTLFPACIPCEFSRVAETLSGTDASESFVIPSQLLYSVWSFVDYMAGYTQQDAHEFLIAFLNSLSAQLDSEQDSSVLNGFTKIFTGLVQSQLVCTVCGNTSSTNESFIDLSLTVDRYNPESNEPASTQQTQNEDGSIDLLDSIDHFTATEILHEKVKCETCGIEQQRTKRLRLVETPELLVLHFKRFDFFQQKKVSRKINFPIRNLNLNRFELPDAVPKDKLYQLIGVVCHFGTLHQGHYISYVYCRTLCAWMKCDDENVTVVEEKEVQEAEAYLLFYQRI